MNTNTVDISDVETANTFDWTREERRQEEENLFNEHCAALAKYWLDKMEISATGSGRKTGKVSFVDIRGDREPIGLSMYWVYNLDEVEGAVALLEKKGWLITPTFLFSKFHINGLLIEEAEQAPNEESTRERAIEITNFWLKRHYLKVFMLVLPFIVPVVLIAAGLILGI